MDRYREQIKKESVRLSNEGRLLFAALTCEKLYPNYVYFYRAFNWGDPNVLDEAIGFIFRPYLTKIHLTEMRF